MAMRRENNYLISVIKGGALGDFLLTLPLLAALRDRFPAARIRLISSPERAFLVKHLGIEVLTGLYYPGSAVDPKLRGLLSEEDLLISISEAAIDPLPYLKPHARFISIPSFPPPGLRVHVTDYLFERLRSAGLDLVPPSSPFLLPTSNFPLLASHLSVPTSYFPLPTSHLSVPTSDFPLLTSDLSVPTSDFCLLTSDFFVLHPGSGSPRKNWPAENFAAVARRLKSDYGAGLVVLGGEADEEPLGELKKWLAGEDAVFIENAPLPQIAGILQKTALYLGNDSGITHLAALLGVPTVAIFGPSDPAVWAPRGDRVAVISAKTSCSPCSPAERRQCPDNLCLKSIPEETVIARAEALHRRHSASPLWARSGSGRSRGNAASQRRPT